MDSIHAKLLSAYHYDPITGHFHWKNKTKGARYDLRADIFHNSSGYLRLHFEGKHYQAHRVAWLFTYNEWPKELLDHINGDKTDNRIENLREADIRGNLHNCSCHRDGKIPGIYKSKFGYKAKFRSNGKRVDSSYFDDIDGAIKAYIRLRAREGIPVQPDDLFSQAVERYRKNIPPE